MNQFATDLLSIAAIGRIVAIVVLTSLQLFLNPTDSFASAITFGTRVEYQAGSDPFAVDAADYNRDGKIDLAIADYGSHFVSIMINIGDGTFATSVSYDAGSDPTSIRSADFNGDGYFDLVVANEWVDSITVLINSGDGTFAPPSSFQVLGTPYFVHAGDIDGDGNPDLVVCRYTGDDVLVLKNDGTGLFSTAGMFALGSGPYMVVAADIDGDGLPELAAPCENSNAVYVLKNSGNGVFGSLAGYAVGGRPQGLCATDVDDDGDIDLISANSASGSISVLTNLGNGNFSAASNYGAGSWPISIVAADFDGDSWPDLALANFYSGNVSVHQNNGLGAFVAPDFYSVGGSPRWICAADFDGDYLPDLAITNEYTVSVFINSSPDLGPFVASLAIDGRPNNIHVSSHAPVIEWVYEDLLEQPQDAVEIAIGFDNSWQIAEMWNPAPFASADTFVVYNGAPLEDGETYWLRLRVNNGLAWSQWAELMFRMNSVPGVPGLRLPVDNSIVNTEHPTLVVRNPSDAENDSMLITFELSADSFATSIFPIEVKMSSDSLTSFWVNFALNEDLRFWWRVKASDYYEESGYSPIWSFWINSVNSTPTAFSLLSPPNGSSPALPGNLPEFTWQNSLDFDPGDSVEFTLQLAIDPSFSFLSQISGLTSPNYLTATPLEWGRRYWWRVKAEDQSTGVRWSNETFDFKIMALGDADGSGTVTISDVVFLINYIFGGGPAPNPIESGDADCSGAVTISDVVYLINYIFAGTAAPCEP